MLNAHCYKSLNIKSYYNLLAEVPSVAREIKKANFEQKYFEFQPIWSSRFASLSILCILYIL